MTPLGTIVLVACYELGHQPLAVAWPAAFLERLGITPAVLDLSVEPFDADTVARARLVAISVPMHTALRLGVAAARRVRAVNPTCHIAFYGHYAALNAEALLDRVADSVLAGESEGALVELAERLGLGPAGAPGDGAPAPSTAGARCDVRLEKLPFPVPSRSSLPSLKKYAHLERDDERAVVAHVETSRGCRHRCRHCPIPSVYGGRFFVVPRDVVLADIRQQVEAGAAHVTFGDPDFLNGPGHAFAVARALHAEFPALTFDFTAKIEHLLRHRGRLAELAALGCLFVVSAAEALSDDVLRCLGKGHTRADVVAALAAVRDAGIAFRPTWVPFTPWSTLEDYAALLEFVEAHDLVDAIEPVQYSIRLLVPPGSLLLESLDFRPFATGFDAEAFNHRWAHPDPRMDALQEVIATLVAEAADRREDAPLTFNRVRAAADRAAGATPRAPVPPPTGRRRAPRLTEPWFC